MSKVDLSKGIHPRLKTPTTTTHRVGQWFTSTQAATFGPTSVPTGTQNLSLILTTPTIPFVLMGACITITGTCTSSQSLTTPVLSLSLFSGAGASTEYPILEDTMTNWGGTSYTINGTTGNFAVFGTKATGGILDNTFTGNQQDQYGAHAVNGQLIVGKAGSGAATCHSFFGKSIYLRINHGLGGNATLTIPYKVDIWGFLMDSP